MESNKKWHKEKARNEKVNADGELFVMCLSFSSYTFKFDFFSITENMVVLLLAKIKIEAFCGK